MSRKSHALLPLLNKEIKLSASPLSFFFLAFALMAFIPGYPILVSQFFVCLGIFQTFQNGRESNDIVYSAMLPISKKDIVKSRYIFVLFIELLDFILSACFTLIRMTLLKNLSPYVANPLMNANFFYLGFSLLILMLFNVIFVRGFFKTGYYFAKHFIAFIVLAFVVVASSEVIHYIPSFEFVSVTDFSNAKEQCIFLAVCALLFCLLTVISEKSAQRIFEKIDL